MKKPFNLRLPVLLALSLAAGIVTSTVIAYFGADGVWILAPAIVFLFASVAVAAIARSGKWTAVLLAVCAFYLVGSIYCYCVIYSFMQNGAPLGITLGITGTVEEVGTASSGRIYLVLGGVRAEGNALDGKLVAYLGEYAGDYCESGYTVSFSARLSKRSFIDDGAVSYGASEGIKYYCTVQSGLKATYRFSLFSAVNTAIKNTLYDNLYGETASVCYAMLTGNSGEISGHTLSAFRYGGVAHIFAVSGLHIGVIFAALSFIFKKLGFNRFVSAGLKIAFVGLYAGVCGFSPSSVRAVVMCSVAAVASALYRKYDSLNAVSVAGIILLIVNPLYLFGTGFILSFGTVLGILFLRRPFISLFKFLPTKLRAALATGASAQIASFPALLNCFGYVSAAGFLLNLIVLPLVSVLYVVIFFATLIGAVIPVFGAYVLPYACLPLELFINFMTVCGFENAAISLPSGYWLYAPFIVAIAACTDKVNARVLVRVALVVASVVSAIIIFVPKGGTSVTVGAGYSGGYALVDAGDTQVVIITQDFNGVLPQSAEGADALVVAGGEDGFSAFFGVDDDYPVVYMRGSAINLPSVGTTRVIYADNFTLGKINFSFRGDCLFAETDGSIFAVCFGEEGARDGADFCLNGAMLYANGRDYDLGYCGEIRLKLTDGGFALRGALPAE